MECLSNNSPRVCGTIQSFESPKRRSGIGSGGHQGNTNSNLDRVFLFSNIEKDTETSANTSDNNRDIIHSHESPSERSCVGRDSNPNLNLKRLCPFCENLFKGLGNHLCHCHKRDGRDYEKYLSHKTLGKRTGARRQQCPHCGKKNETN